MDESRFLILGANGQVGRALHARFPKAKAADRTQLNVTDYASVNAYDWSGVDVILNAAGYTKVDLAETTEGRKDAWAVNGTAVANLARIATEKDLTLVHISSEYVFDGTQETHTESEPLTPLSSYGGSKAAGDIAAQATPKHYVLRTSWVVGDGNNFVRTMIGLAAKNINPTVVSDQIGRLTFTDTLAEAIDVLVNKQVPHGVYNVSNSGEPASWAEVTRQIFAALGRDDLTITDTITADYFANKPDTAKRPLNSTFDLTKIRSVGLRLSDWQSALQEYVKQNKE